MAAHKNKIGMTIGKLLVLRRGPNKIQYNGRIRSSYICKCSCGNSNELIICNDNLRKGHTESCGCYQKQRTSEASLKYDLKRETVQTLHNKIANAIKRCTIPENREYHNYGGRGIKVHESWIKDTANFIWYVKENFPNIEELISEGKTLDREDTNGNYEPGNIRFVSMLVQANNKRNNRYVTFNGKTQSLADHCRELNLSYATTQGRIYKRGLTEEQALSIPLFYKGVKNVKR